MVRGIGVDIIEVRRFVRWKHYPYDTLRKIFSGQEIAYCLQSSMQSAQRFAARFAAKEALVKALATSEKSLPLLYVCRHASIARDDISGNPSFLLTDEFKITIPQKTVVHVSLSHTKEYATAFVIIEEI